MESDQEANLKKKLLDEEMKKDPQRRQKDMLTISVNSAANLNPQADTSVVIYQGNRMAQTGSARGARPAWNQPLMFEIEDFNSSVIISLQNKSDSHMAGQELLRWEVSIATIQ